MPKDKKKSAKSKSGDTPVDAGQVSPASPVEKAAGKASKKAASKASSKAVPKAKEASSVGKKKPAPRKPVAKKPAAPKPQVEITHDDIALRAYFIAERRNFFGAPGDSASDWIEAERQLRAEAGLS